MTCWTISATRAYCGFCASGIVAYAGASPSCCEYSRLKLKPGGPQALRTPEFLQGRPDLTSAQLLRVQDSNIMLERCIICIRLVSSSGGHGHLEQPSSAMSWQEPVVPQYLQQEACSCVSIAACGYGRDWNKTWMLASTFSDIEKLADPIRRALINKLQAPFRLKDIFLAGILPSIHLCWLKNLRS